MAFVHPQFNPVAVDFPAFTVFGRLIDIDIHWYGLMYLLSFLVGWAAAVYRTRLAHVNWTQEEIGDYLFYMVFGVVLGGRLGYILFYRPDIIVGDPLQILKIWEGGMSYHGGMLGVFIASWLFGRKVDRRFFEVTDFVAPMVPIGLFFGRIANFINAELIGRASDGPWAMIYPQIDQVPRHPSQLYEVALEGVVFFVLLWWFASKPRPLMAVSGLFMLGYGCLRFTAEFFREPDAHLGFIAFDWLTMGQLLCVPMMIVGLVLLAIAYTRNSNEPAKT